MSELNLQMFQQRGFSNTSWSCQHCDPQIGAQGVKQLGNNAADGLGDTECPSQISTLKGLAMESKICFVHFRCASTNETNFYMVSREHSASEVTVGRVITPSVADTLIGNNCRSRIMRDSSSSSNKPSRFL